MDCNLEVKARVFPSSNCFWWVFIRAEQSSRGQGKTHPFCARLQPLQLVCMPTHSNTVASSRPTYVHIRCWQCGADATHTTTSLSISSSAVPQIKPPLLLTAIVRSLSGWFVLTFMLHHHVLLTQLSASPSFKFHLLSLRTDPPPQARISADGRLPGSAVINLPELLYKVSTVL